MNAIAREANERGRELLEAGELEPAELHFRRALELEPDWAVPAYNLGLIFKRRRCWPESLRFNALANRLDPEDESARWNLGIAATATGDWATAARCWEAIGLPVPKGPGPWDYGLGMVPIRVSPEQAPEVVWCHRLDPARARILNVPTAASRRRCGDLILHDGEPVGTRRLHGRELSVFNELELLEPSQLATFRLEVRCPQGTEGLLAQLGELGYDAEDWSNSLHQLCRACSEGRPHVKHDEELPPGPWREVAVAAPPSTDLARILEGWKIRNLARVL